VITPILVVCPETGSVSVQIKAIANAKNAFKRIFSPHVPLAKMIRALQNYTTLDHAGGFSSPGAANWLPINP
jgi:hypothetical protein